MRALPDFATYRAHSWAEAAAALAAQPDARALAGGTDLLPNLRKGLRVSPLLVELAGIEGFDAIEQGPDGTLLLGAGVTLAKLASDARVSSAAPALAQAANSVAATAHRTAGTLGGNLCQDTRCVFYNQGDWWRAANGNCLKYQGTLCHVAPQGERCHAAFCSDVAPVLLVMQAAVEVLSSRGAAWRPVDTLWCDDGAAHLGLAHDELVGRVRIPPLPQGTRCAFAKARARGGIDFPLAAVAVAASPGNVRVAVSGAGSAPVVVTGALSPQEAAKQVARAVTPMRTSAAPANYRRQVASALTERLLHELGEGTSDG
ncbi:MAG: FAD binding domain-containing protein [Burkholderiales bacterium]|nr:FAD binding domain-containing protein [Burkholderiales bacterium]